MKTVLVSILALVSLPAAAFAADAPPDLKGNWAGQFRTVIFGNNSHHPGSQTPTEPPRVREIPFYFAFEGQDGGLLWGESWSDPAMKEPFAASITGDGKSIIGSDTDGSFSMTIEGPDKINLCYTQTGLSPSHAMLASCGTLERVK